MKTYNKIQSIVYVVLIAFLVWATQVNPRCGEKLNNNEKQREQQ